MTRGKYHETEDIYPVSLLATMPAAALADSSTDSANWPLIRDSLFPGSPEIVESMMS